MALSAAAVLTREEVERRLRLLPDDSEHPFVAEVLASDASMRARALRLQNALRGVLDLVESGYLVRDVSRDAEPGWALRQIPAVRALSEAAEALSEAELAR